MISGYEVPINIEKLQAEEDNFFPHLYFMCLKKEDVICELRVPYSYYVLILLCFL